MTMPAVAVVERAELIVRFGIVRIELACLLEKFLSSRPLVLQDQHLAAQEQNIRILRSVEHRQF